MGWRTNTKKYQSPPRASRVPRPMAGAEGDVTRPIAAEGRSAEAFPLDAGFEAGAAPAAFGLPTPASTEESGSAGAEAPPCCWIESFTLCEAWS